jgi:hypothetical protein
VISNYDLALSRQTGASRDFLIRHAARTIGRTTLQIVAGLGLFVGSFATIELALALQRNRQDPFNSAIAGLVTGCSFGALQGNAYDTPPIGTMLLASDLRCASSVLIARIWL